MGELERCCNCDEPTGRAGRADDSLYCECGEGPFCEDCWDEHHRGNELAEKVDSLEAEMNMHIGYSARVASLYYEIAEEVVGEDEVKRRFDKKMEALLEKIRSKANA